MEICNESLLPQHALPHGMHGHKVGHRLLVSAGSASST
eukprot:CAMPEP_0172567836 /NCGR_PEP_ID=MMETSP1067-20121228/117423_1 /TAXON_ID=265564 ORGANISM="Thalassiosira punctigera, Strain Tpunct2005C2" /NCGR_SAMPLE_ID=MMETSP1067 /ASSEMBLY_ACC=CAM_ASM_000444 /LENGTH=37 /DNA_ID= /DNA_START= /DNA_END= /DNA_ORIENTATION=